MEKLEWSALEYEEKERSADWFWALSIIVVASSIAAALYGNYFFAVLIILGGGLLGFFSVKKPDIIHYALNEKGLQIRNKLFPYENIISFWIEANPSETGMGSTFFIKSERVFMPVISMLVDETLAPKIRSIMLAKDVTEEEIKEHAAQKVMEFLGL